MKAKKGVKPDESKAPWLGFFKCNLTEELKARINGSYADGEDALPYVLLVIQAGYKVSVNFDEKSHTYHVSATGVWAWCANAGYTITVQHAQARKGLYILWFMIMEFYQNGRWPVEKGDNPGNEW